MNGDVAFVQMRHHRVRFLFLFFFLLRLIILRMIRMVGTVGRLGRQGFRSLLVFRDQHCHAGSLRFIVLLGDIENVGADDFRNFGKDAGQPFRIVFLVDIINIRLAVLWRFGVTNIVHIEAQGLGQIVEPI